MIKIKTLDELKLMRNSGKITASLLDMLHEKIQPGVTTVQLDAVAEKFIRDNGGVPAFKGYKVSRRIMPFPASICSSINNEVVHGIPSNITLQEGDIITIDVGIVLNGFCSDAAYTYPVGKISPQRAKLLEVTRNALENAISVARDKNTLGDIGFAVQNYAESLGYGVVRDYTGHGIGRNMHEAPQIPNFGKPHSGLTLRKGMTIAIEPMITAGDFNVHVSENGWTVLTDDNSDAAHFEKTIAITDDAPEVLTPWQ